MVAVEVEQRRGDAVLLLPQAPQGMVDAFPAHGRGGTGPGPGSGPALVHVSPAIAVHCVPVARCSPGVPRPGGLGGDRPRIGPTLSSKCDR